MSITDSLIPGRWYCSPNPVKPWKCLGDDDVEAVALPPLKAGTPLFYLKHCAGWLYFLVDERVVCLYTLEEMIHLVPYDGYQYSSIHLTR
jgi:hypothetical protein